LEYAELIGKNVRGEKVGRKAAGTDGTKPPKANFGSEKELADVLKGAPDRKLNRKAFNDAGYSLASAIAIAKEDPKKFGFSRTRRKDRFG
jgi:hypothetical protein